MKSALVIDDDFDFREIFSLILAENDYAVWEATSVEEAFDILRAEDTFDIIFCDLHLPFTLGDQSAEYVYSEEVGLKTLSQLQWVYHGQIPIVAMSAAPDSDLLLYQERLGSIPMMGKPVRKEVLDSMLDLSSHFESQKVDERPHGH
ncbi:MAG: response regulator [Bdellovibrionales bacterium]|nr:response regulator [Bdellovibrionales bacterium]